MRIGGILSLVQGFRKINKNEYDEYAQSVNPEAEGVWEIFVPASESGSRNERVLMDFLIGSKEQCLNLGELCYGHPADENCLSWQIRPQKIQVNGMRVKTMLYDLDELGRSIAVQFAKPKPDTEQST